MRSGISIWLLSRSAHHGRTLGREPRRAARPGRARVGRSGRSSAGSLIFLLRRATRNERRYDQERGKGNDHFHIRRANSISLMMQIQIAHNSNEYRSAKKRRQLSAEVVKSTNPGAAVPALLSICAKRKSVNSVD